MSEESNTKGQEDLRLEEPDKTGSIPTQLKGELSSALTCLPSEKTKEGLPEGLVSALELGRRPTNVLNAVYTWGQGNLRADKHALTNYMTS
jgi:hypothetical protein